MSNPRSVSEYSGALVAAPQTRIAIVASRFNEAIVDQLIEGCIDTLVRSGVVAENISLTRVPGAFEIPVTAKRWAESDAVDAVICLGVIIRGATAHFDHVAGQCASGIAKVALDTGKPVIYEVLGTDTIDQAVERAGTKAGNKGRSAAAVAIEMVNLLEQLPQSLTDLVN